MKIKTLIISFIIFVLMSGSCFAAENDSKKITDEYIDKQLNSIQINKLESYFTSEYPLNNVNIKSYITDLIKGKKNITDLFNKEVLWGYLVKEVKVNIKVFMWILVLALMSSLLRNLDNSFSAGTISKISNYVIFIIIISISFIGYKEVLNLCKDTIDNMVTFMEIAIPIEVALLVTLGFPITSLMLNPVFIGGTIVINLIFKTVVVITMTVAFAILIVNSISQNIKFEKLLKFLKQANIFMIAILFIAYLGLISIQGLYVTSFDKFSVSSVKFAIGNFIPVIGGFVSDSVDVLLSASYLLKSVLGSVGLIILIAICVAPCIKMIAVILMYKISAMLIEPIAESKMSKYLNEMGNLIAILLASVSIVGIMFFITLGILASLGGAPRV